MSDWISMLVVIYIGVSLVSHLVQFVLWWHLRREMTEMDTAITSGFNGVRWDMDTRYHALRNGMNGHG